ncbi:hypothetical protein LINPERPRIM_LOCUS37582 [Linum perenne]
MPLYPCRKQRRCSSVLHRRFVNSIHQLGGSQGYTKVTKLCHSLHALI